MAVWRAMSLAHPPTRPGTPSLRLASITSGITHMPWVPRDAGPVDGAGTRRGLGLID